MRVLVRADAAADIEDAYRWYRNKSESLGAGFLASLRIAAARIAEHPEAHLLQRRDARRIRLKRFPYGLFYRLYPDAIVIVACFHARRDPSRLDPRLDG